MPTTIPIYHCQLCSDKALITEYRITYFTSQNRSAAKISSFLSSLLLNRFKFFLFFFSIRLWPNDNEEASKLHHRYYSQYGLAIRGLVRHHEIGAFVSHLRGIAQLHGL